MSARAARRSLTSIIALAVAISVSLAPAAMAQTSASAVRITLTSAWSRPSPDPMGLAYQASTGRLIVSDSEVEETKIFAGTNVWLRTTSGKPRGEFSTTSYSIEPTDVAVRSGDRALFFVDDNQDRVFEVRLGLDGRWGTADDEVSSFGTEAFGSGDPEGLGFGDGSLFITDGNDAQVYRLDPGPNARFDGVAPGGDDTVTSFDTAALGLDDPEDIAYDPATARLYLVSRLDRAVAVTTASGTLLDLIDLSASGILFPSGIALAPGSDTSTTHVFVSDRGVDNNPEQGGDPNENDGRIFEFALSEAPPDSIPPATPGNLTIRQSTMGLVLDWGDGLELDLAGYDVLRGDGAGDWIRLNGARLTTSSFVDETAPPGATSTYQVVALDTSGNASGPAEGSAGRTSISLRADSSAAIRSGPILKIPRPHGVRPHDVLVASIDVRGGAVQAPPGWKKIRSDGLDSALTQIVYVLRVHAGEPWAGRWKLSPAGTASGVIVAYAGVHRGDPIAASGGRTARDASTITAPSVAGSTPGTVLVGFFGLAAGAHVHAPDAMFEQARARIFGGSGVTSAVADEVLTTSSRTGRRVATASASAGNAGQVVLLRPTI